MIGLQLWYETAKVHKMFFIMSALVLKSDNVVFCLDIPDSFSVLFDFEPKVMAGFEPKTDIVSSVTRKNCQIMTIKVAQK